MVQSFLGFVGRALLSLIFITAAIHTMMNWSGTEQFVTQTFNGWAPLGVNYPWVQEIIDFSLAHVTAVLLFAVLLKLIGGLLVFLGLSVRLGAFLLLVFIIPATILCHHFWNVLPPQQELEMQNFMKNLSITGGLLLLLLWGSPCKSKNVKPSDAK